MIELRTLGLVQVTRVSGAGASEVALQPKPYALLIYLAAASARGMHRRADALLLLWSELPESRARRALRQALYQLRQKLGTHLLKSGSREEIGLDWQHVWCDVAAFDDAISANRLEEALALYQGDLAPGFSVRDAPEFDRWLYTEREARRRRSLDAACRLAEAREEIGDHLAALRFAHRAASLAPASEVVTRWCMALEERLGDRAGALGSYDELSARLDAEFGAAPSAETDALAGQIRARLAEHRPRAHVAPPRRDESTVAVLPFTVFGDQRFGFLREGMADLLSAEFSRPAGLRAVDPRVVVGVTAGHDMSMADELAAGQRTARQFDADLFVLGHVFALSHQLRLVAAIYEADGAGRTEQASVAGDEGALLELVDRLAAELIARMLPRLSSA